MVRRSSRLAALRKRQGTAGRHDSSERPPKRSKPAPKKTDKKDKKKESPFKVEKIDFDKEENETNHHTDEYEKDELVIRRGQAFTLSVALDSLNYFNPKKDEIVLHFEIGEKPSESPETLKNVKVVPSLAGVKDWAAQIDSVDNNTVKLQVMTSPAAVVGKYQMSVKTKNQETGLEWNSDESHPIYILFNAWCEDDDVYMPDEAERNEYVLNEDGLIWRRRFGSGKPWYFGQFEEISLDCVLHLLYDLSDLDTYMLGNPVLVSRALSALINSNDDDGVLVGNWSGDYDDGISPSMWSGSIKILEKFMAEKESVCYGQCWVFSGVLTTLGRTLGIPTRSVTNFDSAHDTDGSVTIDKFYDSKTGKWLEDRNNDSVWNFHVWNDCWFKRKDLPSGYDGWQAVDSTPQEESKGIHISKMCCGPAPLTAIKEGYLDYGNDTAFIFAEVNGDKVEWSVDSDTGAEKATNVYKDFVGTCILTKPVGEVDKHTFGLDIQSQYKYGPGKKEDEVVKRAVTYGSKCKFLGKLYGNDAAKDVTFKHTLSENVVIGENAVFKLQVKNTSSKPHMVSVNIQVRAAFYTGVVTPKPCKVENVTVNVPGKSEKEVTLNLSAEDYLDFMVDDNCVFKVYFQAFVEETQQKYMMDEDFVFDVPPLLLECPKKVQAKKPFKVTVSFTNPLSIPLPGGVLNIEGRKIINQTLVQKTVPANGVFSAQVTLHADLKVRRSRSGRTLVRASFNSKILAMNATAWIYLNY